MPDNFNALREHMGRVIVGQQALVDRLLIGILTGGHLLVEGLPGLAKTLAVRSFAQALGLSFRRIQFTPDMIPGDITGTEIFLPHEGNFRFEPGPIFSEVLLADEINRAPPKVQSALLEAMQEHQVTVSGTTRPLPGVFLVMATQNPIEQEGTYPLPEAQLDRFLLKVNLDYLGEDEELRVLRLHGHTSQKTEEPVLGLLDAEALHEARMSVDKVYIDEMLERYIVALVRATRAPELHDESLKGWVARGASPRAILGLAQAGRARAFLADRDFVDPADLIELAPDVLNHRVALSFSARADGLTSREFIAQLLERVPVP